jgi:hypothetical protein
MASNCRFCVNQANKDINLFTVDGSGVSLAQKAMFAYGMTVNLRSKFEFLLVPFSPFFQIRKNDGLPSSCCLECKSKLDRFYVAVELARHTDPASGKKAE